jgi:site-specific DNA-methyltransferase (adenine-specific)
MKREIKTKVELYNDNFENFKRYNIPKAQLIIADIPYNIGNNFYASRSDWYVGGEAKTEKVRMRTLWRLIVMKTSMLLTS